MGFYEILDQVVDLLRRRGRVTYRALQREFQLDEDTLTDLKDELLYAHPEVRDDEGRGLVWTSTPDTASTVASPPASPQDRAPLAYTPTHLAEQILATRGTLVRRAQAGHGAVCRPERIDRAHCRPRP
jgi:hypothetical protein